ncbi:Phosphocarrier protein NPr [bacterium HR39]|nr:Phosphocarrier protein NPr [bacterium HR39]
MSGTRAPREELRARVRIVNARGLHARAAARLARLAGTFEAEITVARDDLAVPATSILGLMMLAAAPGTEIDIAARGPDAEAALSAVVDLVRRGFDEED